MSLTIALLAVLQLAHVASAAPSVFFPLNAQLPPAARLDTFFTYTLSPHTFESSGAPKLSLGENSPSWLSLESDERRLYGTPKSGDLPDGDIVGQDFAIIATDDTGSVTMNSTLVVAKKKAPVIQIPLSQQIDAFGKYSAPNSLLSYPSTEFRYSFSRDTFVNQSALNYYAVSANHSPLPAWVHFDVDSLSFFGKTPPFESLVQPPETFELSLVAADILGFAGTSISFAIVVGQHKLATTSPIITLNATRGQEISYNGLDSGLTLDDKAVQPGDLTVNTRNMPQWLQFNSASGEMHGTPGSGDHSTNFTITFSDNHLDSLDVLVVVNVATGLFKTTFSDMQIRPGAKFEVDLKDYLRDPEDNTVQVSVSPTENWLNVEGLKIYGTSPKDASGSFDIKVDVNSKSSKLSDSETLHVAFLAADGTPTNTGSQPSDTNSSDSGSGSQPKPPSEVGSNKGGRLSTGDILLATVVPILFIAFASVLFIFFLRRRRANRNSGDGKVYGKKVSSPVPGSFRVEKSANSIEEAERALTLEKTKTTTTKVEPVSPVSARPRSSATLGGESIGEELMDEGILPTIRGHSRHESNRQSWETVEGDMPVMSGGKSMDPEPNYSSHPALQPPMPMLPPPAPVLAPPRMQAKAMPKFHMYPKATPPAMASFKQPPTHSYKSIDAYSSITTSSAALPYDHSQTMPRRAPPMEAAIAENEPNWEALTTSSNSGDDLPELQRPALAALPAKTTGDLRTWTSDLQSSDSKTGILPDASFESGENWRVFKRDDTGLTYEGTAPDSTYNAARPETIIQERSSSPDLLSPSKWGNMVNRSETFGTRSSLVQSISIVSLRKDDSAKFSDGSYKAFI